MRVASELLGGALIAVMLGLATPCFGQSSVVTSSDGHGEQTERSTPPAESSEEAARRLYDSAIQHYNVAEYDRAIADFRRAYYLTNAPELLYNIAQSYRLRGPGHCASALQFYKNYLRLQPRTPKRASVEAAVRDMEACARTEPTIAPEPDVVPPVPSPPAPPAPATRSEPEPARTEPVASRWPFVIGGAGLGVSLLGGGLLLWSRLRFDALSDEGCAPACNPARTEAPRALQTAGGALLGVGGAMVIAGIVTWLVEPHTKAATTAVRVLPSGAIAF